MFKNKKTSMEKYLIRRFIFLFMLSLLSYISIKEILLFNGNSFLGWEESSSKFNIRGKAIVGGSLEHAYKKNSYLCTKSKY